MRLGIAEYIYDAANIADVTTPKGSDGKIPMSRVLGMPNRFERRNDRLIQKPKQGWITVLNTMRGATSSKQFRPMELTMPERPSIHVMRR